MVCCHDDSAASITSASGILENIKAMISSWFGRVRGFLKRKQFESSQEAPSVATVGATSSISTPHHIPFYDDCLMTTNSMTEFGDGSVTSASKPRPPAAVKQQSRWPRLFRTNPPRDNEVELQSIEPQSSSAKPKSNLQFSAATAVGGEEKGRSNVILKPADLWRADEAQMLQGRYNFDPNFSMRYQLTQLLGEGSFGFVWVAERVKDRKEVAVKFILRDKVPTNNWIFNSELGLVPLEVHIMKMVMHRNIIQFLDYYSDYRFVYLVTEVHGASWTWPNPLLNAARNPGLRTPGQLLQLANSSSKEIMGVPGLTRRSPCDLFECIEAHGRMPESTIKKIFVQLLDAVLYLYSLGIVHRDLKDENVVVDEDYNVKLIDFGSASFIPQLRSSHTSHTLGSLCSSATGTDDDGGVREKSTEGYFDKFNGTIAFAAPEIIRGLRYRPSEAEVWSLGVLLYTMVFKKSPFNASDAIIHTLLNLPHEDEPGLYDLLRKMLQKNPLMRIRLEEISNHPFLAKQRV